MELKKRYDALWEDALQKFERQAFELDPLIDAEDDTRYGITLRARPSEEVRRAIATALGDIKDVAPDQHYYPLSDMHVTVLSIISCYPGFSLADVSPRRYARTVASAVRSASPFSMRFEGVTASPSCIMVQGFSERNQLGRLRAELRASFKGSSLQHSIDQRYALRTAHATVIRFKQPFSNPDLFLDRIATLRDHHFGACTIDELELVANDWYHRREKVNLIQTFSLAT